MVQATRVAACGFVVLAWGCSPTPETEVVVEPAEAGVEAAELDTAMDVEDGDVDAAEPEAGVEAGETGQVTVGILPTTEPHDAGMEGVALSEAVLVALAAGSTGLVMDEEWDRLEGSDAEWERLAALATYLEGERRTLLLSVSMVDAMRDGRPASVRGQDWTGGDTRDAMRALVDRLLGTMGTELGYLSLGVDADRYLGAHPSEAAGFVTFVIEAMEYVRTHPDREPSLGVGVSWSQEAWRPDAAWWEYRQAIVEASDVVMMTLYGVDEEGLAAPPGDTVAQLRSLLEATGGPLVLHRAGYTTSELVGANEPAQAQFVTELLSLVDEHRSRIPFVGLAMLTDPEPEECLRFAQSRNAAHSSELYAFWCSAGLRTRDGEHKEGFAAYMAGASMLSTR